MGKLLAISISSGIIMLMMYAVYKLLLANEKQHAYNRFVLLSIYVLAPIFAIVTAFHKQAAPETLSFGDVTAADLVDLALLNSGIDSQAVVVSTPTWILVILAVYLAGILFFTVQTIVGQLRVHRIVKRCQRMKIGRRNLFISDNPDVSPFSYANSIVINRDDYDNFAEMILPHEMRHLDGHHFIDLIFARLVIIFNWFNPAAWLIAEELKSVHEYQADLAVLNSGADARQYQMLLIKKAVGQSFPAIANSLNHSKLKKRITMMLKSKQGKSRRLRALALLPAAAAALLVTNIPAIASAITVVSNSDISLPASDKVSEKTSENTTSLSEISVITLDKTANTSTDESKPSQTIYVNGKLYEKSLKDIEPSQIESMIIKKDENPDGAIYITLKSDKGESLAAPAPDKQADNTQAVKTAEQMPQFPGGDAAMLQYIMENIRYPETPSDDTPDFVRVIVQFTIETDGSVANPQIIKGGPDVYNEEAKRVVMELPKFTPGTIDGEPVAVTYTLPINFRTKTSDSETAK